MNLAVIEDVERSLTGELKGVTLVGEVDLDLWGPAAEEALRERVARSPVDRIGRLWPATFATYLVYEGIHEYDENAFWPNLSIPELRSGQATGPVFERALGRLGLPTFDDLESSEGFKRETRGRYIRRIHLHGGLPRSDVPQVLELLVATLRSGARSAAEVADRWLAMDLYPVLRSKAAERLLVYTGDFGIGMLDQFIALLQGVGRADPSGVPAHLIDGVAEFLEHHDTAAVGAVSVGVPRVRLLPGSTEPVLVVPRGRSVVWRVNDAIAGVSSRQMECMFPLAPPPDGIWQVSSNDGERPTACRFLSMVPQRTVFVFDERGRLHRRGTTLGGLRATVLAPHDIVVTHSVEEQAAGEMWPDHKIVTCDLRHASELSICVGGSSPVVLPISHDLGMRLAGDLLDGVTTVSGDPVVAGAARLAFSGFVPDLSQLFVTINGRRSRLDQFSESDGQVDITGALPECGSRRVELSVARADGAAFTCSFGHVPGLRFYRPALAPPDGVVEATIEVDSHRKAVLYATGATEIREQISSHGVTHELCFALTRLRWALETADEPAPIVGAQPFALRKIDLQGATLHLFLGDTFATVELVGAGVEHRERPRRSRAAPGCGSVRLRSFADTAGSPAAEARMPVVLHSNGSTTELGVIEARFEPFDLQVEHAVDDDHVLVAVKWNEGAAWPDRQVRVWDEEGMSPLCTEPVADGQRSLQFFMPRPPPGRYRVEVATASGWSAPRRPPVGPSCVATYFGSDDAVRLQAAILGGDRRAGFSDEQLTDLVPMLADLTVEPLPHRGTPTQRLSLLERIADDHWRAVDVLDELADRFEVDEDGLGRELIEPLIIEFLPAFYDFPIRNPSVAEGWRLDHLWQVAPLAAACLDAGAGEDARSRWIASLGVSPQANGGATRALDRLGEQLPRAIYIPSRPAGLLEASTWARSLRQIEESRPVDSAHPEFAELRYLATQLERPDRKGQTPRWIGVTGRVRRELQSKGALANEAASIVAAACAHLDPETGRRPAEVLAALHRAYGRFPDAVRCSLLFAAASLRILEHAGPLAHLVT